MAAAVHPAGGDVSPNPPFGHLPQPSGEGIDNNYSLPMQMGRDVAKRQSGGKEFKMKFSEQDLNEIKQAVAEAEKSTSGEIVPFVSGSAGDYLIGTVRFVVLVALLTVLLFSLAIPEGKAALLTVSLVFNLLISLLIIRFLPKVKLLFMKKSEIDQQVKENTLKAFYNNGLYKTRDKTGILIALFMLEKRVEVLGDEGINEKLDQSAWDEVVKLIIYDSRQNRVKDGFIKGIKKCGELLTENFPIKADDTNELENNLVIE